MKKIITFLFAIFFAPSISFAVPKYYIEGQINYTQVDDVDTNTFSGSTGGLTFPINIMIGIPLYAYIAKLFY